MGESNLNALDIDFVRPTKTSFMFTVTDTSSGLKQFSMADHRGFDSTLTLILPETEQEYFQAQIQYKFLDNNGVSLAEGIASVDVEILPDKFMVYNNYPNPFNPITAINYDLPEVRDVNIIIYDLLGRTIRHLDLNKVKAGRFFYCISYIPHQIRISNFEFDISLCFGSIHNSPGTERCPGFIFKCGVCIRPGNEYIIC